MQFAKRRTSYCCIWWGQMTGDRPLNVTAYSYSTPPQDSFWCCCSVCFISLCTHILLPTFSLPPIPTPPLFLSLAVRGRPWPCWLHRASWVWSRAERCHGRAAAASRPQPSPAPSHTCQPWPYPQSHPHHAGPTAAGQHLLCPAESGQGWELEETHKDR